MTTSEAKHLKLEECLNAESVDVSCCCRFVSLKSLKKMLIDFYQTSLTFLVSRVIYACRLYIHLSAIPWSDPGSDSHINHMVYAISDRK